MKSTLSEKFKVSNINDLELLYSVLREQYPSNEIEIQFNWNTKEYTINVTDKTYCFDPEIPVDLDIQVVYGDTDSIFAKFKYNRDDFERNRRDTFRLATVCGDNLTNDIFDRKPIELEFEKVFHPFILLTKKRYIANKFENTKDPFDLKGVDAKGIALTRRDYCPMVKKCYKKVIDTILQDTNKKSTDKSKEDIFDDRRKDTFDDRRQDTFDDRRQDTFDDRRQDTFDDRRQDPVISSTKVYLEYIDDIFNYKIPVDDLVVSAMLAASYKTRPVHVQLAEKLKSRKEEVQVGSRIPYIYIETDDLKKQKSELGEDPKYAKKHNLKYNRSCYLEQLAKPILGFYKVVLKDREKLLDHLINYTNETLIKCGGKKLSPSDFKIED
jgi:DNA polymerase delta subunit 1